MSAKSYIRDDTYISSTKGAGGGGEKSTDMAKRPVSGRNVELRKVQGRNVHKPLQQNKHQSRDLKQIPRRGSHRAM